MIEYFYENPSLVADLRQRLRSCYDIERCLQRLSLQRGGPRDIGAIADTVTFLGEVRQLISTYNTEYLNSNEKKFRKNNLPKELVESMNFLSGKKWEFVDKICSALVDAPPANTTMGGYIADGYDSVLDELRVLRDTGVEKIKALVDRYKTVTGAFFMSWLRFEFMLTASYFVSSFFMTNI